MLLVRPDPANREYAMKVLGLTYWQADQQHGTDVDVDANAQRSKRKQDGLMLLRVANGDWRSNIVTHHCNKLCCGDGAQQSFTRMVLMISAVVLRGRPCTPMMSRWLSCAKAARFYARDPQCSIYAPKQNIFWVM